MLSQLAVRLLLLAAPSLVLAQVCDIEHDVIVVGAGPGGASAAAYLQSMGVDTLLISDGPDNSGPVGDMSLDDSLWNRMGEFQTRTIPNTAVPGMEWVQVTGIGGNFNQGGAVHRHPPINELESQLGGGAAAAWDWIGDNYALPMMGATDDQDCNDFEGPNDSGSECLPVQLYAHCHIPPPLRSDDCSVTASVASFMSPKLSPMAKGLRKSPFFLDFTTSDSVTMMHDTKATELIIDADAQRLTGVLLDNGQAACAKRSVILAGGVWGTAELLMRSFGMSELDGLWEQTAIPIIDPIILDPSMSCDKMRSGSLRLAGKLNTEFILCDKKLIAAWVLVTDSATKGSISLDNDGTLKASHKHLDGEPDKALEALNAVIAELKDRFGDDLSTPPMHETWLTSSHHVGGGLGLLASKGRLTRVKNGFVGDASAFSEMLSGYTTSAAAVAGVWAAMNAIADTSPSPSPPPFGGVYVLDGGSNLFPAETCVLDPYNDEIDDKIIVTQCCEEDGTCRRFLPDLGNNNEGCISGTGCGGNIPVSLNFYEAEATCMQLGLELCEQNCKNKGCCYNDFPVWSRLQCRPPPAPPPSPPPPASTEPMAVLVLDGGGNKFPESTCITDPSQTELSGAVIAAQCCEENGTCRRFVGSNNDAGCIGGRPARPTTYAEAVQLCLAKDLVMCDEKAVGGGSCKNKGCDYNNNPVWTGISCGL